MNKNIFLTIDDAPSRNLQQKVEFLVENDVPAVLFCIGKLLEQNMDSAVDAVRHGMVLGNHSYSHQRSSKISLRELKSELKRTEMLIDTAYQRAGKERSQLLFRFPYGDKAWYKYYAFSRFSPDILSPVTNRLAYGLNKRRRRAVQKMLREFGYAQPINPDALHQFYELNKLAKDADMFWTFDSKDYRLEDISQFEEWLENGIYQGTTNGSQFERGSLFSDDKDDIVLIHDFDHNFKHLSSFVQLCKRNGAQFLSFSDQSLRLT